MQIKDFKKQKGAVEALITPKPSVSLTSKDLPAIKKWKIGKEYEVSLRLRQRGAHELEKGEVRADFEILSAEECTSDA